MQQPSRTARMVAAYRARATERPSPICNDPHARALAGKGGFEDAARADAGAPHLELFIALRTALFDAYVRRFLERGYSQVVVLGAGLDTRAERLAHKGVRFFEVDHPTTQADKLARLGAVPGYPIENATYVPCDFAVHDFVERLDKSGFRADQPAFLVWEGVTYYLPEEAVRATLRSVATRLDARSVIAFDYVSKPICPSPTARETLAQWGEPLLFGVDHALPLLFDEGFRKVSSTTFDEIALNLTGTYEQTSTFSVQRAVLASVAEPFCPW